MFDELVKSHPVLSAMIQAVSRLSAYNQDGLRFQERRWVFSFAGPRVGVRPARALLIL
jgi:hypothetical protein